MLPEFIFELTAAKKREELVSRVRVLKELVDWIDVPDSPMGVASQFSPVVSCFIKSLEDVRVIAHVRTIDLSRVALTAIARGLGICGVERVVYVRGDIADGSTVVRDLEPEDAVSLVRQLDVGVSPGLTLSLRKDLAEILKRIYLKADFYLVLNLNESTESKLVDVAEISKRLGLKVYPYLVVASEYSYEKLVRVLGRDKILSVDRALELAVKYGHLVDGFLISSPLDFKNGVEFLNKLRSRI
ncbi:MAG: methylenetetrahydrofolate reductase [Sulfolobales archaeon]|nr:methylenetetrahydrofolate reductase [Sulfolobales archaeon]MDW8010376.1 methylenetetrahydrofolate reductase [Sulfolobales archaeon]